MTPEEHNAEAERLLETVSIDDPDGTRWYPDGVEHENTLRAALVHATLGRPVAGATTFASVDGKAFVDAIERISKTRNMIR